MGLKKKKLYHYNWRSLIWLGSAGWFSFGVSQAVFDRWHLELELSADLPGMEILNTPLFQCVMSLMECLTQVDATQAHVCLHMSSSYGHPALFPSSLRWFKHLIWYLASDGLADKEFTCNAGDPHFISWVRNIAWRRERLPTPVFWPGEFHEQYSPWGWKESDTTEAPS